MILVTGAAGFIGSVLARELNKLDRTDLILVDRLGTDEKWKNLRNVQFDEFIHADDLFQSGMEELLDMVDFIFHIGACSSTTERNVDFLMDNNVNYSKSLWALAVQKKIPMIYASSAATYGDGNLGYSDEHNKTDELMPLNAYGWSKQVFDQWVLKRSQTPPKWFGLKFFNVYGPNEYHKDDMRSLVHKGFGQINETGKVKLFKSHKEGFKDGEQLRDFIYVKDVCRAMIEMCLDEGKAENGIYNLGTGQARSFKDLAIATFKAMGKEEKIEYFDMPEAIRGQYQYYTQADMSKFQKNFPKFKFSSLEEGVTDYVQNHLMKDDPFY
ncbi:MAG: ADP-glyceromanno-heptose 6-epimerase [Deltaproteobacteria bacterium]|nr:MAG: ADP-glyceromanno-heptose 6-epimerase [Deltaproteobacteria bacterium]TNF27818.1 MAG: ADP-glyceromanno-heptose 6-epimerase [Deltaproteobacteria bacterium]